MAKADLVRDIIDATLYVVLATADEDGRPWGSPVFFAHVEAREFYWVSSPEVTHSRNIVVRPQISMVVFDSHALIGTGQGVYMPAVAAPVTDEEDVARGIEVFSRRSQHFGAGVWTAADVRPEEGLQLYRAVAQEHSIVAKDGRPDHRISVRLT